jgi:hypothetical protein
MDNYTPTHVHLVGSIGLDTVEEVFSTVGPLLGRRLRRFQTVSRVRAGSGSASNTHYCAPAPFYVLIQVAHCARHQVFRFFVLLKGSRQTM